MQSHRGVKHRGHVSQKHGVIVVYGLERQTEMTGPEGGFDSRY